MRSAMDILQEDLLREGSDKRKKTPRQAYYLAMRNALRDELMEDGASAFLDMHMRRIRDNPDKPVYLLDLAVVNDCYEHIYLGRPMQDVSRKVPYFSLDDKAIDWAELDQSGQHLTAAGSDDDLNMARQLRNFCRLLHERSSSIIPPDPESVLQKEVDAQRTMLAAQQQLNEELSAQNEELRQQLEALRRGEVDSRVENEVRIRRREAENQLAQEMAQRRREAEGAFLSHFADALHEQRVQREREENAAAEGFREASLAYDGMRGDLASGLREMQRQLEARLQALEQQLCAADFRMLARSYVSLYASVNERMERMIARVHGMGASDDMMRELSGLRNAMIIQLTQLENAMLRLGLKVIRPREGDLFDAALHESVDVVTGDELPTGAEITGCASPGVIPVRQDMTGVQALVKARVSVIRNDN